MHPPTLVFVILAAATWLIGVNVLVAFHYRRKGESMSSGFRPFAFPFKDFNGRELMILLALLIATFTFAAIGMALQPI